MEREQKIVWEGKFLRTVTCGPWEYAERVTARAGVVIVATTPDDKLILIEQFRVPMGQNVIELPAGLAGDEEDSAEEYLTAAKRELLEETGYEATNWKELAAGPPSAGLSNEEVILFRASGLKKTGQGGGAHTEKITVFEVPLKEIESWLHKKKEDGVAIDPKIFAGLYFLQSS